MANLEPAANRELSVPINVTVSMGDMAAHTVSGLTDGLVPFNMGVMPLAALL